MKAIFKLPRRARALLEGAEPKAFIDANAPQLFRVMGRRGGPGGYPLYHSKEGWLRAPDMAGKYTLERAEQLVKFWTVNQPIKGHLFHIKSEPVLEAQDPKGFIMKEPLFVILYQRLGDGHTRYAPLYLKAKEDYGPQEVPFEYKWTPNRLEASVFSREAAQNWTLSKSEGHNGLYMPLPEAQEPRDFIMGQNPPRTWGELKLGDVLFGEDGAIRVVTKQWTYNRYAQEPVTAFDEYNPCYAYTTNGGPFIQHYTRPARDELLGAYVIGTAKELGPDYWTLMKREIAKQHPEHARRCWPEIFEASAKDFIDSNAPRWFCIAATAADGEQLYASFDGGWRGREFAKRYTAKEAEEECRRVERSVRKVTDRIYGFRIEPLTESQAKDFILNQPPRSPWSFKVEPKRKGAFVEYRTQIFFEGECVSVIWMMKPPVAASFRVALDKLHQRFPFDEVKYGSFWDWVKAGGMMIVHNGLKPLHEGMEPKDFISQLPTVEQVCKDFGMQKTGDEHKQGELLWPGGGSRTTRFQSFKTMLPLNREVADEFGSWSMKELETSVVYSEEEYSPSNILYYARIDVGIGGRSKRFHGTDEVKVAVGVERYLRRLKFALKSLRTTRRGQLERVLASTGFRVRESAPHDEELKKLMEGSDPKQFILDSPTVDAVCAKWQLQLTGSYTTPNPDTEHSHYKGSMRMQRPVLVTNSDPPREQQYVQLTVHYSVLKFEHGRTGQNNPGNVHHHIQLSTDVTWSKVSTVSPLEAEVAERLDLALARFQRALWGSHAKTDDALRNSLHRFLARGWPK